MRTPGGLYTYPDVMVVRGGVELNRHDRLDTVTNPAAILEVLSASTAAYDRGEKFRLYQAFPTLREYLLIDQAMKFVEHHTRAGATSEWSRHEYSSPAVAMMLTSLNVRISLAEIYAGLEFGSDRAGSRATSRARPGNQPGAASRRDDAQPVPPFPRYFGTLGGG